MMLTREVEAHKAFEAFEALWGWWLGESLVLVARGMLMGLVARGSMLDAC